MNDLIDAFIIGVLLGFLFVVGCAHKPELLPVCPESFTEKAAKYFGCALVVPLEEPEREESELFLGALEA